MGKNKMDNNCDLLLYAIEINVMSKKNPHKAGFSIFLFCCERVLLFVSIALVLPVVSKVVQVYP